MVSSESKRSSPYTHRDNSLRLRCFRKEKNVYTWPDSLRNTEHWPVAVHFSDRFQFFYRTSQLCQPTVVPAYDQVIKLRTGYCCLLTLCTRTKIQNGKYPQKQILGHIRSIIFSSGTNQRSECRHVCLTA